MEKATVTVDQVTAAVAEAKVRVMEAAKSRMSSILELAAAKEFQGPAKILVSAALSEIEAIVDSAIMLNVPGITLPALQEARREFLRSRGRGRAPEPEPEATTNA